MPRSIRTPDRSSTPRALTDARDQATLTPAYRIAPRAMTMTEAASAFRDAQDIEGFTPKTQISYAKVLAVLTRYLRERHQVELVGEVTPDHLRAWLTDLRHEPGPYGPRTSRTIQTYCRHMRPFFRWLHEEGYLPTNPAASIKLPKAKKTLIRIFEDDEISQLQQACEPVNGKRATYLQRGLAARDRAIVDLLLDTGIRRAELCALRMRDLDLKPETLYIQGKGQKERKVSLSPHVRHLLGTYLSKWRVEAESQDEALFLADDGRPLTEWGIAMLFRKLKQRAPGVDKRISPHTCRHWFAVNFLRSGGSVLQLQELPGHEDLATVRIYVAMSQTDALEQHRRNSPLEHRMKAEKTGQRSGFRTPPKRQSK
jgi:site-specific recombinase XerD